MRQLKTVGIIALIALPAVGFAAPETPTPIFDDIDDIVRIINTLLNWVFTIFFIVAAIAIVIAAYTYLTAGGSEEKITKAKKQLTYAIVAIAIALLAVSFKPLITTLLGSPSAAPGAPPAKLPPGKWI